ncbi:hypothetical protein PoB_007269500 [Plakobranchus ocellatus]|uniref:Uncharacterized protein n=1 Tax=Plakobranchus ocellatus TaxID=259542 RepID=A0AAV4DQH2_9GAST|nr:hypothetical protein PoB_007269500 [Plakobranchus ocellatus]
MEATRLVMANLKDCALPIDKLADNLRNKAALVFRAATALGPSVRPGADNGARSRDRRVPADLRAERGGGDGEEEEEEEEECGDPVNPYRSVSHKK